MSIGLVEGSIIKVDIYLTNVNFNDKMLTCIR